jgi:hypothetical protein
VLRQAGVLFLIGINVLIANVCSAAAVSQGHSVVVETKQNVVAHVKSVFVIDMAPNVDSCHLSELQYLQLFRIGGVGKRCKIRDVSSWEKYGPNGYNLSGSLLFDVAFEGEWQSCRRCHKFYVVCGSLPDHADTYVSLWISGAKVFDRTWTDINICPQLPLFSVASYPSLITANNGSGHGSNSSYERENSGSIIKPVFFFFCGVLALGIGFWCVYFTARRSGLETWAFGAVLFLLGWIVAVFGGIWFLVGHVAFPPIATSTHPEVASVFWVFCA